MGSGLLLVPVIAFFTIFFYWPLGQILQIGFLSDQWQTVFNSPLFLQFLGFTISQTLLSSLGALLLGLPVGYLLARMDFQFKPLYRSLLTVPFIFPPLAILMGFIGLSSLFSGQWYDPYSYLGIITIHVIYNTAIVIRISEAAFQSEPQIFHSLAETLGASRNLRFRKLTLPHIKPSIAAAALLVAMYCFNSFATVLVLGQVRYQTLEVMIYSTSTIRLNTERAATIAIIQLLINLMLIWIYSKSRVQETSTVLSEPFLPKRRWYSHPMMLLVLLVTWFPIISLVTLLVVNSSDTYLVLIDRFFSSGYDFILGASPIRILFNTVYFGVLTAVLVLSLSLLLLLVQYRLSSRILERWLIPVTLLPLATSAITLAFGILMTHGQSRNFSTFVFVFIVVSHVLASIPFVTRVIFSRWQQLPKELLYVSQTLGASFWTSFRYVIWPYIQGAVLVAALFSFAISIGEFGATFYLARGEWGTISLAIEQLLGTRNLLLPSLYSLLLIGIATLAFLIIERLGNLELKV